MLFNRFGFAPDLIYQITGYCHTVYSVVVFLFLQVSPVITIIRSMEQDHTRFENSLSDFHFVAKPFGCYHRGFLFLKAGIFCKKSRGACFVFDTQARTHTILTLKQVIQRMLPIIHQNINNQEINTVNARDLYKFLEIGKDFSSWIKNRIEQYGFIENQDYVVFENLSSPNLGNSKARPQILIDYHLSLDMAKEVSMVEKNDKGREARKYFIECEKKAKTAPVPTLPFDMTDPLSIMDWSKQQFLTFKQREDVKDAIIQEQRRAFIENLKNATHYSNNNQNELMI